MALVTFGKTPCLLCWQPLQDKSDIYAFSVFFDEDDPLFMYSDGAFHKSCFEKWDKRDEYLEKNKAHLEEVQAKFGEWKEDD